MKSTLYLLILFFFLVQCSKKLVMTKPGDKLFEMSKSPCFGWCPVYTVTVYQNGSMQLLAKENLEMKGTYTHQMDKTTFKSFKTKLATLNIKGLNDEYRQPIADAPSTRVVYYEGTLEKKIFTNFQFPDSLQMFTTRLDEMVTDGDWIKVEDRRISQEYIILLQPEARLSAILQRYTFYEMTIGKRLDPATNQYWVVSAKVNPDERDKFLNLLRADKDIKSVQTNKALESR